MNRRIHQRGFTLIEIGVVLFLAALLIGIAIPSLANISGATARGDVGKLAANIRATRGKAAVSGQTCRIAFDLDEGTYQVECAEGRVRVAPERAVGGQRRVEKEEVDPSRMTEEERTRLAILKKASFAPDPTLTSQLSGGLSFHSVFVSHQEEEYTKGKAFLYFFPSGLGERANIVLQRGDDEFYTLQVSPLAGRVKVLAEKAELPDLYDPDDR